MRTVMRSLRLWIAALFILVGFAPLVPPAAAMDQEPVVQEEPPPGQLETILDGLAEQEYEVSWVESTYLPDLAAGYQAPNRANGFRTYFTASGVSLIPRQLPDDAPLPWRLDLGLKGWGGDSADQTSGAASPSVLENRVDYFNAGLNEWYLNDSDGLHQGFTLAEPLAGSRLRLEIGLSGGLQPVWEAGETLVRFQTADGKTVLKYGAPRAVDASGASLPAALELSGGILAVSADLNGAAFPVEITLMVSAIGTEPDWYSTYYPYSMSQGLQVATAGDVNGDGYSDIMIGLPYWDNGEQNQGHVWIQAGSPSGVGPTSLFSAYGEQEESWFGYSISTAGDVNRDGYTDIIIGAPMYDVPLGNNNVGAAYIFHGSAGYTDSTPERFLQGDQPNENFGISVAFAGDIDRDYYSDVIIGAPGYNTSAYGQGRVYVYYGTEDGIGASEDWRASNTTGRALMGFSVATAGDVNGDRYADIIVGAPEYSGSDSNMGRAMVWHGSASGINEGVYGTFTNYDWHYDGGAEDQKFAWSVSTTGDVNGDGYSDIIIGSPYRNYLTEDCGVALVFHGSSGGLEAEYENFDAGSAADDHFGWSVASAGDVNGDGFADVIAGCPDCDIDFTDDGRAYIWYGHSGGISHGNDWNDSGGSANTHLGYSVATAGDVNGDGYSDVIVSAQGGTGAYGFANVYYGGPEVTQESASWTKVSNMADAQFGYSVSSAGDVNGDGYSDIIVGAPYWDTGSGAEGGAYVYTGSETGLITSGIYWSKHPGLVEASGTGRSIRDWWGRHSAGRWGLPEMSTAMATGM